MKLETRKLSKSYGNYLALDKVSLSFTPGIYALLGPNGAGKSTLMNVITDTLPPSGGSVLYNGKSIKQLGQRYRQILGYMPQQQGLYDSFSAKRFLGYIAALKGLSKKQAVMEIERTLALVNLSDQADKRLGEMSGGMKQRLLIAQAIMGNPELLILDEPTAGLDPKERMRIRNIISTIAQNKIVIFATHVVSDIEFIAKEVILLQRGRIIAQASPQVLCDTLSGKVFEIKTDKANMARVASQYLVSGLAQRGDDFVVRVIADTLDDGLSFQAVTPELEDIYLFYFDEERGVLPCV